MERKIKKTPPRLPVVFDRYAPLPLYLITICTLLRQPILACPAVLEAFEAYARRGQEFGVAVGRYVIMPDHIHAFVSLGGEVPLGRWVKGLKRQLERALTAEGHAPPAMQSSRLSRFFQPGAFDHLLRNDESYEQKWLYVRANPVRKNLASRPEDWPYQGEIAPIDRV